MEISTLSLILLASKYSRETCWGQKVYLLFFSYSISLQIKKKRSEFNFVKLSLQKRDDIFGKLLFQTLEALFPHQRVFFTQYKSKYHSNKNFEACFVCEKTSPSHFLLLFLPILIFGSAFFGFPTL